jgi:hypothetical protein
MHRIAELAPDRMTEHALWKRMSERLGALASFGHTDMKSSEVRAIALEVAAIARELHFRGRQLQLWGDQASGQR